MGLWISIFALLVSTGALLVSLRSARKKQNIPPADIPEHIWEELKLAIPEADYNYLRTTSSYMAASPGDMIARLNHVGAVHDPDDPKQVRLSILELRLAEMEKRIDLQQIPTDLHIIWLSVASIATLSSFIAFIFYLLQAGHIK